MIAVLIGVSAALTSVRGVWAEEVFAAAWQRIGPGEGDLWRQGRSVQVFSPDEYILSP